MSVAMTETKVHVGDETISESKEANDAFAVPGAVHGGDATGSSPTTATTGRQVTAASPRGLCCKRWCNKGAVSNYITACFMVLGIALCAAFPTSVPCRYVLSFGLFGFAGGVTNWLAILMLFDRVPFLIGSGVIPRRFKELRATVKETIMDTFFDKEYLEAYLQEHLLGPLKMADTSFAVPPSKRGRFADVYMRAGQAPGMLSLGASKGADSGLANITTAGWQLDRLRPRHALTHPPPTVTLTASRFHV